MRNILRNIIIIVYIIFSQLLNQIDMMNKICVNTKRRIRRNIDYEEKNVLSNKYIHSAYFTGNEIIRYEKPFPNFNQFTIDMFIKLEGGQINNVPILRIYSHCSATAKTELVIGVKEFNNERDLRIFFKLQTESNINSITQTSHARVFIKEWIHVVAVYGGTSMQLFINQAKVEVSNKQSGAFLKNIFQQCVTLELGGDSYTNEGFRGEIRNVNIWNTTKSHRQITLDIKKQHFHSNNRIFQENFNNKTRSKKYYGINGEEPNILITKATVNSNNILIDIPNCGKTTCDNPEIIKSYTKVPKLLERKIIRYRLVNLAEDNSTNAMFTDMLIHYNNQLLNEAFSKYNITLKPFINKVNKTYLRHKTITIDCYGHCEGGPLSQCSVKPRPSECFKECVKEKFANGVCNPECNKPTAYSVSGEINQLDFNWDGGDCCNPMSTNISDTCFDYSSPLRAFLTEEELKTEVGLTNENFLNIFPVKTKSNVLGKASFPWTPNVYSIQGGIIINADDFKNGLVKNLIHEIGHSLGLWHVHRGVSEISKCNDECAEIFPSMEHGDLCSDTNPTPKNPTCNSTVADQHCGFKKYTKVPFKNYMSYSSGSCTSEFTMQQTARMHCYIDKYYQRWSITKTSPSIIPLPPRVLSFNEGKLVLTWIRPMGLGNEFDKHGCSQCQHQENRFQQYATSASSPLDAQNVLHFSKEIVGPPDTQTLCAVDGNTWMTLSGCNNESSCYVETYFKKHVIPYEVTIWITYNARNSIRNIQLRNTDSTFIDLGSATSQCDVPYTRRISSTKLVESIRIYVTNKMVSLDAIMLTSATLHNNCKTCQQYQPVYKIYRKPRFQDNLFKITNVPKFEDSDITDGVQYEYKVATISANMTSKLSPPLLIKSTDGFCGDGKIEKHLGEECDDANIRNGDGCDIECQKEKIFDCKLEPSLCYRYDKDGICEGFERETNRRECGFYTPDGYTDQWANKVTGPINQSNKNCNENKISGKPDVDLTCVGAYESLKTTNAWRPCKRKYSRRSPIKMYQIQAKFQYEVFPTAVIIYLASDGATRIRRSMIIVEIKNNTEFYHQIHKHEININCKKNPLSITVDKNVTFHKTDTVRISFKSSTWRIAISAIVLRTKNNMCGINEYFDKKFKLCLPKKDQIGSCHVSLKLKDSMIKCENENICNVTCNTGFLPQTVFTATCMKGKWKFTETCKPIDCGTPQITFANVKDCKTTTFGSTCTFSCDENTDLLGYASVISCNSKGLWDQHDSYCVKSCSLPVHVENAVLYFENGITNPCWNDTIDIDTDRIHTTTHADNLQMGSRCRFLCIPGYQAVTSENTRTGNIINIACDDNGAWKHDGRCEKITCPMITTYQKLLYNCTDENNFESICTTTCLTSKTVVHQVTCLSSKQWSTEFDYCTKEVHCKVPQANATIDVSFCKSNTTGHQCKPNCSLHDNMSKTVAVFQGKEEFDNDVSIYCMPNGEWLPSPTNMICVEPCLYNDIGDGHCDCINNKKHCKYDGGDCCTDFSLSICGCLHEACGCLHPNMLTTKEASSTLDISGDFSGDSSEVRDDTEEGGDDDDDD